MARHETDREDLFAAATALVPRAEFECAGQIIVAGFRRQGRFTVYFTPDFMVDFDTENAIRRAYHNGLLYRAEPGRRLTRLRRQRSESKTTLIGESQSEEETGVFLEFVHCAIARIEREIPASRRALKRVIPIDQAETVVQQIAERLRQIRSTSPSVADGLSR